MTNRAVIYDDTTGEILSVVTGKEETFLLDCDTNQSYLLTEELDLQNKIVSAGQIVSKDSSIVEQEEIAEAWIALRKKRLRLLNKTDWTQVPDAPVDAAAWATYRQQLRDLPANTTDPRNVEWPVPPS